ncbi:MAG TPA: TonB family protein [Thermoanaerobaculia bacterium]|nr:TonB family protein [Thermoanaerobaculia bacterium]
MRFSLVLSFSLCILAASRTAPGFSLQEPPAPPPPAASRPQDEVLVRAFQLIGEGKFKPAKTELDRAAALAGGPCGECLLGLSHVYASEKKWDKTVDTLQRAIPLLKSPGLLARAYNQLGIAYVALGSPDDLTKAEDALRRALDAGGSWGTMARFNLAEVLFRLRNWPEVVETARRYLKEAGPDGTARDEARVLLCRARVFLPDDKSPEPSQQEEPKRVEGDVQRPRLLSQVNPAYTEKAREAGTTGRVVLEAIIDDEGCVRNVRAIEELPNGLTESAMDSVRRWVFSPATLDGRPVKVYYVLTVNFSVQRRLS